MFALRVDTHHHCALWWSLLTFLVVLTACGQSPTSLTTPAKPTRTGSVSSQRPTTPPTVTALPTSEPMPTSTSPAPARYSSRVILRGIDRPDDLAFDTQERLLFSDEINGLIGRVNADGTVSVLLRDANGPEGLVVRPDGTIIFAEQETNRIVSLAPGASTPVVLRTLPGVASTANCKHGVDGIAFDPTTSTLIIPDSPTNTVYRMSLDGKTLTPLASGIVRPVGAGVDAQGNIFIADECGNAVWRITPGGTTTRFGGFGMPDDVVPDGHGNLFIIDLAPAIHDLIRMNLATGKREVLASQGYIEPQGLVLDNQGDIYVSDDYAHLIVEYLPA